MKNEWEVDYDNWLAGDQLEDTPERREAFRVGWEWSFQNMQEKMRRIF